VRLDGPLEALRPEIEVIGRWCRRGVDAQRADHL